MFRAYLGSSSGGTTDSHLKRIIIIIIIIITQFQPDSARKRSHYLHETYQLPCVQEITPDDGQRRCPKHVEFYDKIKF
jgi:hypothetical protein